MCSSMTLVGCNVKSHPKPLFLFFLFGRQKCIPTLPLHQCIKRLFPGIRKFLPCISARQKLLCSLFLCYKGGPYQDQGPTSGQSSRRAAPHGNDNYSVVVTQIYSSSLASPCSFLTLYLKAWSHISPPENSRSSFSPFAAHLFILNTHNAFKISLNHTWVAKSLFRIAWTVSASLFLLS